MSRAFLLVVVLGLLLPVTASAAEPDRVALVARELREDPVLVSDSLVREVSAEDVAMLRREVARMPVPTYVVLVPRIVPLRRGALLEPGEGWPALLRDALGRDGLYVVGGDTGSLDAGAFGVRTPVRGFDATFAAQFDLPRSSRQAERVRYTLGLLRGEPRLPRAQRARIAPSEGGPQIDLTRSEEAEPSGKGSSWWTLAGVLGLPLAGVGTYRRLRRHVAPGPRPGATTGPRGAPPHARTRASAEQAIARLAQTLDAATTPPDRAFDLAAAASAALDRRRDGALDDLGALVLAELGLELLRTGDVRVRCFYDPRHGPARDRTTWELRGETLTVPACKGCARDVAGRRAPSAVLHDGRPYWERDGVWARTGFGSLDPDVRRALARDGR